MCDHKKSIPLRTAFPMCLLVAVVPLEAYNEPFSNVKLCYKMQAPSLITLTELSCANNFTLF